MPYLEVLNGPEVGKKAAVSDEPFFIGRETSNHLILSDRTVSRRHAVINCLEGSFVLSDLDSLKGILVNGSKAREAALDDGDEIAVGAVRIRFHLQTGSQAMVFAPAPRRPRAKKIALGTLILLLLASGAFFFLRRSAQMSRDLSGLDLDQIAYHYKAGLDLYNRTGDLEGAKKEWYNILQLDPKGKTDYARKAMKLMDISE